MKELRHKMRIWRILLVFILLPSGVYAQDKLSYATPLGKSIFHREVRDANRTVLKMSEVSPISAGIDGLVLVFHMRQDLSKFPFRNLLSSRYYNHQEKNGSEFSVLLRL